MGKALSAAFLTLVAGLLGGVLGGAVNFPELGPIAAIAVMGGFILYFNDMKQ